ncbi:succinylglutamate desuccinylase/aspartoacylase family protein [Marinicella sp. W31]|uniref:succinylglutamate desuccinylase/aspartoacylase family protein n=1 Tax=Marinicella sp. W31 TaxID=3023713 RepID=UPI0037579298
MKHNEPLIIGDTAVLPGETKRIELPTVSLYTDVQMSIPIFIKRGKKAGPTLLVCSSIHGDELNGIEIISRLIQSKTINRIKGTLIAVPFVNGFGILNHSRYLPDRRDLNRSFPGSKRGSLAARIAHLFMNEIVNKCDFGIDLHTGAIHRSNYPQIRANLEHPKTLELAKAFTVPVLINANLRDGSLRESADNLGIPMLLYEGGQALRFDEFSIKVGLKGITNVMRYLQMLPKLKPKKKPVEPFIASNTSWVRASESGFVVHKKELGDRVKKDDLLAEIKNHYGDVVAMVKCFSDGIVIGKQNIPLVQEGEAIYHIAYFEKALNVVKNIESFEETIG